MTNTIHIAKNKKSKSRYTPITHPIHFKKSEFDGEYLSLFESKNKETILGDLKAILRTRPELLPEAPHESELLQNLMESSKENDISIRNSHNEKTASENYHGRLEEIVRKCGTDLSSFLNTYKINVVKFSKNYQKIKKGDVIVTFSDEIDQAPKFSRSKGKSIHDDPINVIQTTEDDICNGVMPLSIPKETRSDPSYFKQTLIKSIKINPEGCWKETGHENNITFLKSCIGGITEILTEVELTVSKFQQKV